MKNARARANNERRQILATLDQWLETPLLILSFVWLALFIVEYVRGELGWVTAASDSIWAIFIVDFAVKFVLSPDKLKYLKINWLTAIALALPALRIFRIFRAVRIFRAARFARGVRFVRVLTSLNRGLRALGASLGRRGFGYVLAATLIVLFGGAAGMYGFEHEVANTGISDYGSAIWWTAMLITSIGSDYFPKTTEGRLLCFLISLYGFVVFGYLTATLASFFVDRDAKSKDSPTADKDHLIRMERELRLLREEIQGLRSGLAGGTD
jgi:voltage-gated potassium channel